MNFENEYASGDRSILEGQQDAGLCCANPHWQR
jgi:hypothetical protein